MREFVLSFATLLACAIFGAGCNTYCADCGTCGINGPVEAGLLTYGVVGVDAAGVAAADIDIQNGPCMGEDVDRFRVSYANGSVTVASADGLEKLDETKVTSEVNAYSWTDRDLQLTMDRSGNAVVLTFKETALSATFVCQGGDGGLTCTPK